MFAVFLPTALLVGGLLFLGLWSCDPRFAPVQNLELSGSTDDGATMEIASIAAAHAQRRSLLWIKLSTLHRELLNLPWVDTVKISRAYPDTLRLEVKALHPLAKLNDKLIDSSGRVFTGHGRYKTERLPLFSGDESFACDFASYYHIFSGRLSPLGLEIRQLQIAANGAVRLLLSNNLLVILGRADLTQRLEGFLLVYQHYLRKRENEVAYVDLRYTNGVAIGWKTGI